MSAKSKTLVIEIDDRGVAQAMHFDSFPLSILGPMEIQRASELKFDPATQTWGIFVANDNGGFNEPVKLAKGFPTYEIARDIEVRWFNYARGQGVTPESERGQELLRLAIVKHVVENDLMPTIIASPQGCGCDPSGSDGLRCPDPTTGKLLCE